MQSRVGTALAEREGAQLAYLERAGKVAGLGDQEEQHRLEEGRAWLPPTGLQNPHVGLGQVGGV